MQVHHVGAVFQDLLGGLVQRQTHSRNLAVQLEVCGQHAKVSHSQLESHRTPITALLANALTAVLEVMPPVR